MLDLEFSLTKLAKAWQRQSVSELSRAQRLYALCAMAKVLVQQLGFNRLQDAAHLKPKHALALLKHWQDSGLSAATVKNNLAHLRTWAGWIGKKGLIPASNAALGAQRRSYMPKGNRAFRFTSELRELVSDERLRVVFALQEAFGLRREEALKVMPTLADKGQYLELLGSWCKNGKTRAIPIRTPEQRALLDLAKSLTGTGKPMGAHLGRYKSAVSAYQRALKTAGMVGGHGLRHQYAQDRYVELTGRAAPIAGGLARKQLGLEERARDKEARLVISNELGHAREQITVTYLGR